MGCLLSYFGYSKDIQTQYVQPKVEYDYVTSQPWGAAPRIEYQYMSPISTVQAPTYPEPYLVLLKRHEKVSLAYHQACDELKAVTQKLVGMQECRMCTVINSKGTAIHEII